MGATILDEDVVAVDLISTTVHDPKLHNLLVLKKWCNAMIEGEMYLNGFSLEPLESGLRFHSKYQYYDY